MACLPVIATILAIGFLASSAHAEIGAIGSPYVPKPSQDAASGQEAATPAEKPLQDLSAPAEEEKPLLEVNFSQKRVYFDRALAMGVKAAEQAKPGVVYEVVSYLPAAVEGGTRRKNASLNQQAEDELRSVVGQLRAQGVPTSRIRVATHTYKSGEQPPEHHRVSVFVK